MIQRRLPKRYPFIVRRKRVRYKSIAKMELDKEYQRLRRAFLTKHPQCAVFPRRPATDIHHIRGRTRKLQNDTRYWLAVSRKGHRWIETHKEEARSRGWLAPRGKWQEHRP